MPAWVYSRMHAKNKIIDNQMITRCIQYFCGEMVLGLHHFSMANTHHAPEGCGWGSPRKTIALMTSVSHTPQQGLAPGASENFESESLNIRMGPQVGHANPISATNAATNAPIFAFNVVFSIPPWWQITPNVATGHLVSRLHKFCVASGSG